VRDPSLAVQYTKRRRSETAALLVRRATKGGAVFERCESDACLAWLVRTASATKIAFEKVRRAQQKSAVSLVYSMD
jgi:hypothetical protein